MTAISTRRLLVFSIVLVGMALALVGRLVQLQVVGGGDYAMAARSNHLQVADIAAPRGLILDRDGRPLVANSTGLAVVVDRSVVKPDDTDLLRSLGRVLELDPETVSARLIPCGAPKAAPPPHCHAGDPYAPATILAGLSHDRVQPIVERAEDFPGVSVEPDSERAYPAPVRLSHVLGYLGQPDQEDLDSGRPADVLVGRAGLEQRYDRVLSGAPGRKEIRVDASGQVEQEQLIEAAVPGSDLLTSLSTKVQRTAERKLREHAAMVASTGADPRGSVVVLDVESGGVVAMASYPDYDPTIWTSGISQEDYRHLSESGALLNTAVQGGFAPGSTFKPFTALAMAQQGADFTDTYSCPAQYATAGRVFRNHGDEAYGRISLARAIEVSCNTAFYRAADRMWRQTGGDRIGAGEIDPVAEVAQSAGFGSPTGVDLAGEASGAVASPKAKYDLWEQRKEAWCRAADDGYPVLRETDPARARYFTEVDRANCDEGQYWRQGDALNAAVGQGLTLVTPLQLAVAYAALANDGQVREPRIVTGIRGDDGSVIPIDSVRRADLIGTGSQRRYLRAAMRRVTTSGTAAAAFTGFPLGSYPIAGKTGSAQVDGVADTSWFASFGPAQKPRFAVVAMMSEAGAGGVVAAEIVRAVWDTLRRAPQEQR